ncbi:Holliday junction branch migration protein RuvA [[Mycoplasma] gypis]|uniref:Holliday junction branch migration complex subunit RuvA n=1 Tax=[Mycoplasma] gypis TaxID=92404 RepID=A0ABZ2RPH7_9BACT|nr:Holliday junction branch migration protein RuvA [[Mycoplasma] gypis]MBN0919307.1 Holliday junction branch migration protein RuvA [[Mycoplasma] gypis]
MLIYKYGKIVHVNKNYIILENNKEGELIYVPLVERFKLNENMKVFIHEYETEHFKTTYGFDSFKELVIFEDLLSIQGIGPKTALAILNEGWENILRYIAGGEIERLTGIPYLSTRSARQLIFEYQSKYEKFLRKMINDGETTQESLTNTISISENLKNIEKSLKVLGFKQAQIKQALETVNPEQDLEKAVEEAIKIISTKKNLDANV